MPAAPLTHREITAFFAPLVLWTLVIMATHSFINATLAREVNATLVLAAYNVAITLYRTVNTWSITMQQMGLAFMHDRRAVRRLTVLGQLLLLPNIALLLLLAFTPVGDWVYGGVFGASAAVTEQAKLASFWFLLIFPVEMGRNLLVPMLMRERRTTVIFSATVVRTLVLVGALPLMQGWLHGVALGAAAVGLGFTAEVAVLFIAARSSYRALPAAEGAPVPVTTLLSYGWPIAVNVFTETGIVLAVNIFLGRLENADLALAAFGVVQALSMIVLSPMRNLTNTAQALTHSLGDMRTMRVFTVWCSLAFVAVLALLFLSPARGVVLEQLMGLEADLLAYSTPSVLVIMITPPLWAFAALYRGLLARARSTGMLAASGLARLGAVALVGAVTLVWPSANGAVVGMFALGAGFGTEALLLQRALAHRLRTVGWQEAGV